MKKTNEIKQRIEQLENSKKFELNLQTEIKAMLNRTTDRLIDINEELQELERDLEIAEKEEIPSITDQHYGDFTGVTNEDR